MNIGDANAVSSDKIGELTFLSHCKTIEKYDLKTHRQCIMCIKVCNVNIHLFLTMIDYFYGS